MSGDATQDPRFVHLHVHTEYSLLDGACRIPDLVEQCRRHGMSALAITDHGVMYGVIDFYTECEKHDIKPIIGVEVYLAPRTRFDREGKLDSKLGHLTLLAETEQGYRNLLQLVSAAYLEGFYYKPRVDLELLAKHHEGLIAGSACLHGPVGEALAEDSPRVARERAGTLADIFGPEHFYIELMDHGLPEQKELNPQLIGLAREMQLPLLATNDVHYVHQEHTQAHDVLLCIGTQSTVNDPSRLRFRSEGFYLKSPREMAELFAEVPEALENTVLVAERCNVKLGLGELKLPAFDVPEGHSLDTHLRELCEEALPQRYFEVTPEIRERLDYELGVIAEKAYSGYFLIVGDFIREARARGMFIGPGRGSAVGSVVSYLLGISDLDPLKYGLIFERMLHSDRVSPPDIDLDFPDDRREEIIEYVKGKYGEEKVAQVITFGTLGARAAIRDSGRALEIPPSTVDEIAKMIPFGDDISEGLEHVAELKSRYDADPQVRQLIDTAQSIEGLARHASTHAAAVVIAQSPLTDHCPVQSDGSSVVTQFSMDPVTQVGLVKMDFLGLKTLSAIESAVRAVADNYDVQLDVRGLPLDDAATYALLARGDTPGVFQVESEGMRRLLRMLKPDCFDHIVPLIALYRPGPLDEMDTFCAGRHGAPPVYLHPRLEPILRETWGVLLYQEQVMRAAGDLAGLTMAHAELLMRAMSKKDRDKMAQEKGRFVTGCAERGIAESTAEEIWARMAKFAGYGFNKSHSAAYALIVYWTAYLKTHYPAEYMAAAISSYIEDSKQVAKYVAESRRIGLEVLPPEINQSAAVFTGRERTVRFGLGAIKGIGMGCAQTIVDERHPGGPFTGLADFCRRLPAGSVGRSSLETLVKAGAFDELGERAALLAGLDQAMGIGRRAQSDAAVGQVSLFGDAAAGESDETTEPRLPAVPPMDGDESLAYEKELLGLYISDHPLVQAQDTFERVTTVRVEDLHEYPDGQEIVVGGSVGKLTPHTTRAGAPMLFFTLQSLVAEIEVTVFPRVYEQTRDLFQPDALLVVTGKLQRQETETINGERAVDLKVLCDRVRPLTEARKPSAQKLELARRGRMAQQQASSEPDSPDAAPPQPTDAHLCLRLTGPQVSAPLLERVRSLLQGSHGAVPVRLMLDDGRTFALADDFAVAVTRGLMQDMADLMGPSAAILVSSPPS